YEFFVDCQRSVPEAIIAFLEGNDYEDTIRKAVSLGGDSDTIGCMAGAIAEAYYGMPEEFKVEVFRRLDEPLVRIAKDFQKFYHNVSSQPENSLINTESELIA
ncbi:MAG: ADP-ribosylglycohydrolase family protein, partial [Erysipelotrichaceae bacterium]|nr:ADP-ribosylglycohydrolase family protein [Erysipelotrichaceae bacterium]